MKQNQNPSICPQEQADNDEIYLEPEPQDANSWQASGFEIGLMPTLLWGFVTQRMDLIP